MQASDFAGLIPECSSEVLESMYFTSVLGSLSLDSLPEDVEEPDAYLAFNLQFAGDISGRFGLRLAAAVARNLTANFLGEQDSDLSSEEVSEVIGELANMLCGSVMSRVEGEHSFALTHPEPGMPSAPGMGDVLTSTLDTDSGTIAVWVSIEECTCPA
jgi:CheY-specific phosphatase CheX